MAAQNLLKYELVIAELIHHRHPQPQQISGKTKTIKKINMF